MKYRYFVFRLSKLKIFCTLGIITIIICLGFYCNNSFKSDLIFRIDDVITANNLVEGANEGSLKEDELRAREQLDEIKKILNQTKEKVRSFKLPSVPKNYYVELSEAMAAINELIKALDKRPISIKILNVRVDTARDLVLKVYNTINETVKTARMAEVAIVYGNRYRVTNREVDFNLIKAENNFLKGNFKSSLENAINAINIVEPGIYKRLLEEYK